MTLEEFITEHRKNEEKSEDFVSYLYKLLDKHDVKKSSDVYIRANLTKASFQYRNNNRDNGKD